MPYVAPIVWGDPSFMFSTSAQLVQLAEAYIQQLQAQAAQLVLSRTSKINGNLYYLLDPAARLIESKHPLAATLLRRAMIEDTLNGAKSTRYKHATRHLLECQSLAAGIRDFAGFETHEAFVSRLRTQHGRKTGFWRQLAK